MQEVDIDCFGDICPVPMLKAKKKLDQIIKGESFKLVTDHSCVLQSMKDKYEDSKNVAIQIEEVLNGVWEIVITKK